MPVYTFGSGELGRAQAAGAFEAQLKDVGLMGGDNSDDEGASADAEQDGEEAQEGSSSENDIGDVNGCLQLAACDVCPGRRRSTSNANLFNIEFKLSS